MRQERRDTLINVEERDNGDGGKSSTSNQALARASYCEVKSRYMDAVAHTADEWDVSVAHDLGPSASS